MEQSRNILSSPGVRTMTALSHILSWGLSPVLLPTYAILLIFGLSMLSFAPMQSKVIITCIVFGFTGVLPSLAVALMIKFGDVKDAELTRRSDRTIPYVITGCCLLGCGLYLSTTGLPRWVSFFYIGASIACAVNLLVTFKWKISAHGAGIGGFIAMLMLMNRYGLPHYNLWVWGLCAVIAGGCLGTARVWLGRHTPMQTIMGEIVGIVSVMSMEFFIPD